MMMWLSATLRLTSARFYDAATVRAATAVLLPRDAATTALLPTAPTSR